MFRCDTCNITTNNKFDYKRHVFSPKHQRLCSDNAKYKDYVLSLISDSGAKNIPPKPRLEICEVSTPQKTPINEIVHIDLGMENEEGDVIYDPKPLGHVTTPGDTRAFTCRYCKRIYINRTGLWRHNKKYGTMCITNVLEAPPKIENPEELKSMIQTMMLMNEEFKTQILELYKKSAAAMELTTTYNNNMMNCNNNTFNLQMFLNEHCKDAMNMKEFVNSIKLNTDDLECVGKLGYVEGMSNILISNLNKTELHKRPVHCSDVKREMFLLKNSGKWEQDTPDCEKLTNAVLAVEHKNVQLIGEWAALHPNCMDSNSNENIQYLKLSKTITDGAKDGNISKVLKKLAKNVYVNKEVAMAAIAAKAANSDFLDNGINTA